MTQKCLITNEELFLDEVINKTLPGSENLFFLVGYFYFSGFEKIYKNLQDKNIKILVGMDIEKDFQNKFKEYELIEKVISSRGKIKKDWVPGEVSPGTQVYQYKKIAKSQNP